MEIAVRENLTPNREREGAQGLPTTTNHRIDRTEDKIYHLSEASFSLNILRIASFDSEPTEMLSAVVAPLDLHTCLGKCLTT